jgi:hypothetical protein
LATEERFSVTKFLEDYETIDAFAAEVDRHPRTVKRWTLEQGGLPYTTLGDTIFIHIPTAREWMLSRMVNPNPTKNRKRR